MSSYPLYFSNSQGERRRIAFVSTPSEVFQAIEKFLEEHNYKSYYTRIYQTTGMEWCIDVGSWSECFYVSVEINLIGA